MDLKKFFTERNIPLWITWRGDRARLKRQSYCLHLATLLLAAIGGLSLLRALWLLSLVPTQTGLSAWFSNSWPCWLALGCVLLGLKILEDQYQRLLRDYAARIKPLVGRKALAVTVITVEAWPKHIILLVGTETVFSSIAVPPEEVPAALDEFLRARPARYIVTGLRTVALRDFAQLETVDGTQWLSEDLGESFSRQRKVARPPRAT